MIIVVTRHAVNYINNEHVIYFWYNKEAQEAGARLTNDRKITFSDVQKVEHIKE